MVALFVAVSVGASLAGGVVGYRLGTRDASTQRRALVAGVLAAAVALPLLSAGAVVVWAAVLSGVVGNIAGQFVDRDARRSATAVTPGAARPVDERSRRHVAAYVSRVERNRQVRRRIGIALAAVGALPLVHGAASWAWALMYVRRSPPETLPGALVATELWVGGLLVFAGLALARWDDVQR